MILDFWRIFTAPIIVMLIFIFFRSKASTIDVKENPTNFIIRMPHFMIWAGASVALFFSALIVIMTLVPNETVTTGVYIWFTSGSLLGLVLFSYALKYKVRVSENAIAIYSPFLKEKVILTNDITKVDETNHGVLIYVKNKKVASIENFYVNYALFLQYATKSGMSVSRYLNISKL